MYTLGPRNSSMAKRIHCDVISVPPQTTPARPRRAEHQPVAPPGEELLRQCVAEHLVVGPVVLDDDAALGDAGGAAGLEDVDRLVLQPPGDPAAHRTAAQPLVLEVAEQLQ